MVSLRRNAGAPQEWLMGNELLKGRLSYRWSKTKDPHMSEYLNAIFMELENSWGDFLMICWNSHDSLRCSLKEADQNMQLFICYLLNRN